MREHLDPYCPPYDQTEAYQAENRHLENQPLPKKDGEVFRKAA
jgi:hypothetical protein